MKKIKLTQGRFALVDNEDLEKLIIFSWSFSKRGYAETFANSKHIKMHRFIMHPPKNIQIDHKNGDKLDNRKKNLRLASNTENNQNKSKQKNNTSGYKGVSLFRDKRTNWTRWTARIKEPKGKYLYLGYFDAPEKAAKAYDQAAKKYHGKFARINQI